MNRPKKLRRAIEIVDSSGALELLAERLPSGGRRRALSERTLLTAIAVNALNHEKPLLNKITDTINGFRRDQARRLGLIRPDGTRIQVTYRQVRHLFKLILSLIDSSPNTNRQSGESTDNWLARIQAIQPAPEEGAERDELLDAITNGVVWASIPEKYRNHNAFAFDWTDVDSAAYMPRTLHTDISAWLGRRRGDSPGEKKQIYLGYYETVATSIPGEGEPVPELVFGFKLSRPPKSEKNRTVHEEEEPHTPWVANDVRDTLVARGIEPGLAMVDSAYPFAVGWTDDWIAREWETVFDLNSQDMGPKGQYKCTVIIEGQFYCQEILKSEKLLKIEKVTPQTSKTKRKEIEKLLATREGYRWRPKEQPGPDGTYRIQHPKNPAVDEDGKPVCCGQWTLEIPPDQPGKTRQKYVYRSDKWKRMYNQRGAVERSFKKIKDPTQEDLKGKPQRIRGRAVTQLFRAFYWVSVNDRSLAKFNKDRAEELADLERMKSQPKRRKRRREVTLETMRQETVDARAGPKAA